MLVVADSSPLIVLVKIDCITVLPALFREVLVPPAVDAELRRSSDRNVSAFYAALPAWLTIRRPQATHRIPGLHAGETEAIHLVTEIHADILLVDERKAYKAAVARKITAIGTVRLLERAAEENLLDLAEAFRRVKETDFWIAHALLDERLHLHQSRGTS